MRVKWPSIRSIIFFFLFLEAFFWLGGWIFQSTCFIHNYFQSQVKGTYKILCVGDSITKQGEYPQQLETILNQRSQGLKFKTMNLAIAGATTPTILSRLPGWIEEYKPNMVIVMSGNIDTLDKDKPAQGALFYIQKIKTVQMINKIFDILTVEAKKDIGILNKIFTIKKNAPVKNIAQDDSLGAAFDNEPQSQVKLYTLAIIAQGTGRPDITEALFEKFLQNDKNKITTDWVMAKYAKLLVDQKEYDKFVYMMPLIKPVFWPPEWVKGYCHGDSNMEHARQIIETLIHQGADIIAYGNLVSCYEEGGNHPLAKFYLNKITPHYTGYYSPETKQNLLKINDLLFSKGIQPVFCQYPNNDVKKLIDVFQDSLDEEKIIFIDNDSIFKDAVKNASYDTYFSDHSRGFYGHLNQKGAGLLASNIADKILPVLTGNLLERGNKS